MRAGAGFSDAGITASTGRIHRENRGEPGNILRLQGSTVSDQGDRLTGADLTHAVITADALHTQHGHGTYLRSRGAHYIAVVKKNHPACSTAFASCPGVRSHSTTTSAPGPTTATRSAG